MLNLLVPESVILDCPAKARLLEIRRLKFSKVPAEMLYEMRTPLLHSLEAFFDDPDTDYDRFSKFKVQGSLMASPSTTAAYLMRTSDWDTEAEAYLRRVLEYGEGSSSGAFPSAFPSTIFETSWVYILSLKARYLLLKWCQ